VNGFWRHFGVKDGFAGFVIAEPTRDLLVRPVGGIDDLELVRKLSTEFRAFI
jgi:hypothetical protein